MKGSKSSHGLLLKLGMFLMTIFSLLFLDGSGIIWK